MTSAIIFSLEDAPDDIAASLDRLQDDGYRIEQRRDVDSARQYLAANYVDLVLVDERVGDSNNGGSMLITELKRGSLGPRNADVPFVFVTGDVDAVDRSAMSRLPGFLDVWRKGHTLTRDLLTLIEDLPKYRRGTADGPDSGIDPGVPSAGVGRASASVEQAPPLTVAPRLVARRVAIRVHGIESRDDGASSVRISIPAWSADEEIRYPLSALPDPMRAGPAQLADIWAIARVNLGERDPSRIVITHWEPQDERDIRRVPLLIESLDDEHVVAHVPPWEPEIPILFDRLALPRDLQEEPDALPGTWLMVWMNLYELDADRLVVCDFEPAEALDDADGLA
jgi:CheY-like chemotaxis protein